MNDILKRIGGRKLFLVVLVFITTSIFSITDNISEVLYTEIVRLLLLMYPAGAIGQALFVKELETTDVNLAEKTDVRKFAFTLLVFAGVVGLTIEGSVSAETYAELVKWLTGIYITGNVVTKAVDNGVTITLTK